MAIVSDMIEIEITAGKALVPTVTSVTIWSYHSLADSGRLSRHRLNGLAFGMHDGITRGLFQYKYLIMYTCKIIMYTCILNYVYVQDNYVYMQDNYVYMYR